MADPGSVGALILAAGSSRRLGRPKQLLQLDGKLLLQHVVDAAERAGVGGMVLVLGHAAQEIEAALALPANARVELNPEYASGQASSLRVGLAALGPEVGRALILLGDQPRVDVETIRAVAAGPGPIRRARYGDTPGHPVAFDRELWDRLMRIDGDRGARDVMTACPDLIHEVTVGGPAPADVDTVDDATRMGVEID